METYRRILPTPRAIVGRRCAWLWIKILSTAAHTINLFQLIVMAVLPHLLLMEALMEEMEAEARLMPHTGAEYFRDRPAVFPSKLEGKFADRIAFYSRSQSWLVPCQPIDVPSLQPYQASRRLVASRTIDDNGTGFNCWIRFILVGVAQCHLLRPRPRSRPRPQPRPLASLASRHRYPQATHYCTYATP